MRTSVELIVFVIITYFVPVKSTLQKIKFQDSCSLVLLQHAGNLLFDAKELPSTFSDPNCSVTFTRSKSSAQIMFYFEEFNISSPCDDNYLTVSHGERNSRHTHLPGLPLRMCGENSTLTKPGVDFTTSEEELIFTYSFSDQRNRSSAKFSIKFSEFSTGQCIGDGEYQCSNGHCVRREYHCSSEIRVCPVGDEKCAIVQWEPEDQSRALEILGNIVKRGLMVVVIAFVVYFVVATYRGHQTPFHKLVNWVLSRSRGRRNRPNRQNIRAANEEYSQLGTSTPRYGESPLNSDQPWQENGTNAPGFPLSFYATRNNNGNRDGDIFDTEIDMYMDDVTSEDEENVTSQENDNATPRGDDNMTSSERNNGIAGNNDHVTLPDANNGVSHETYNVITQDDSVTSEVDNMTSSFESLSAFAQPVPRHPLPSDEPPSYEDVVAPSYDEVMFNLHKYSLSAPRDN